MIRVYDYRVVRHEDGRYELCRVYRKSGWSMEPETIETATFSGESQQRIIQMLECALNDACTIPVLEWPPRSTK